MLAALGAALTVAGASLAQLPDAIPVGPPVVPSAVVAATGPEPVRGPWVGLDFVFGSINGPNRVPPLVATSPPGTPRADAGVPGLGTTTVLFGGTPDTPAGYNDEVRTGFRLSAGVPLSIERCWTLEAAFLFLGSRDTPFSAASDSSTILARPFVGADDDLYRAALVAFPGVSSGSIQARAASGTFYTGSLDLTEAFYDSGHVRLESMLGYRYYRYSDGLSIRSQSTLLAPEFTPGTQVTTTDDFSASNEFHGAQIGLRARLAYEDLALTLAAKVAGGNLRREVDIRGTQTVSVPGAETETRNAGFLALASNSGQRTFNDFTATPEFEAALRWQATDRLRLHIGYSLQMLINVATAGAQIDPVLNPDLFPPATRAPVDGDRPAFRLYRADVWVQTLQLGAELTW